jgi:hypothetical protein
VARKLLPQSDKALEAGKDPRPEPATARGAPDLTTRAWGAHPDMKREPDYDYCARRQEVFDDCARPRRVAGAHTLRGLDGAASGGVAPTAPSQFSCFKCLSTVGVVTFQKSAPYLRAKLYLCQDCIHPRPEHPPNTRFDCGCTEDRSVGAVEKHWVPPNPRCAACSGTGVIRDKHGYLAIKKSVGHTDERGRHSHTYQMEAPDPAEIFPDGGYRVIQLSTGRKPGRPKSTTANLEQTQLYIVFVANEVAEQHFRIMKLSDKEFMVALDKLTNILFAKAPKANARLLAEWLPMSKTTIYDRRKKGQRLLNQLDRIETMLREQNRAILHTVDIVDELRWAELHRRDPRVEDEEEELLDE